MDLMLEVPEKTDKGKLEAFLRNFSFAIKNEPVPMGKGTLVYIIEGPDTDYGKFEDAVKQEKDYKLWSNPRFEPFGLPKP